MQVEEQTENPRKRGPEIDLEEEEEPARKRPLIHPRVLLTLRPELGNYFPAPESAERDPAPDRAASQEMFVRLLRNKFFPSAVTLWTRMVRDGIVPELNAQTQLIPEKTLIAFASDVIECGGRGLTTGGSDRLPKPAKRALRNVFSALANYGSRSALATAMHFAQWFSKTAAGAASGMGKALLEFVPDFTERLCEARVTRFVDRPTNYDKNQELEQILRKALEETRAFSANAYFSPTVSRHLRETLEPVVGVLTDENKKLLKDIAQANRFTLS